MTTNKSNGERVYHLNNSNRIKLLTVGLINPMGLLPAWILASFTSVKIAPTTGVEADVPYTRLNVPWT